MADRQKENILRIPTLRGGREVLEEARELLTTEQADRPLATLAEIWSVLEDYGVTAYLQLDLGLVRMLDYYTGMVLKDIPPVSVMRCAAAAAMTGYWSILVLRGRPWALRSV